MNDYHRELPTDKTPVSLGNKQTGPGGVCSLARPLRAAEPVIAGCLSNRELLFAFLVAVYCSIPHKIPSLVISASPSDFNWQPCIYDFEQSVTCTQNCSFMTP